MKPKASPTTSSETKIMQDILVEFGATPYCRIYRNNVGKGYGLSQVAAIIRGLGEGIFGRHVVDGHFRRARPITWGVPGSPDIMGWMMGGRALAIEVKRPGEKLRPEQKQWRLIFESMGGLYIFAESVEAVRDAFVAAGVTCK